MTECDCVMRGMTGGKMHPLCPVHGPLLTGYGVPADPALDERLRADLAAVREAEHEAAR